MQYGRICVHIFSKNTGLSVTLTRELVLPNIPPSQKQPLQISDTLTSVSFRGPEYIIQPGLEGVANLVFDVPATARSVKTGPRDGDPNENRSSLPALFEVRCVVTVGVPLGIGRCVSSIRRENFCSDSSQHNHAT